MIQVLVYFLKLRKTFNDKYWDLEAMKRYLVPHNIWPKVQMLCGEK